MNQSDITRTTFKATGKWFQGQSVGEMELDLIVENEVIFGKGEDKVGSFEINGYLFDKYLTFKKAYINKHALVYFGNLNSLNGMYEGEWFVTSSKNKGTFELKIPMAKEEFLTQIEKYKWDLNGLVSYLQSNEAKVFSSDSETLLAAIAINERVFEFASEELKSDKEFVKRVLNEVRVRILGYVSDNLKNDKEVVMLAVSMNGGALQYASQELKADKEVVEAAIKSSGFALQYASSELQSDVDLICDAYTTHSSSLKSVNQNILSSEAFKKKFHSIISKMDKREIKQNFINDIQYIEHLPDHLKNDKELILGLAGQLGLALRFVSDNLKNDKEIVLKALKTDGLALKYASNNLKNDKDVVLEAIKNGKYTLDVDERGMAIEFASSDLKSDIDVIASAYQQNKKTKQFVSPEIYESSEFQEALDRISLIEDDQVEFTVIAGNDEQYSNTLNGSAQELNIVGFPLSNIKFLGEQSKFEDFQTDTCWEDFMSYHGSSEEYGETRYNKIKVIRNNKVIVDYNPFPN